MISAVSLISVVLIDPLAQIMLEPEKVGLINAVIGKTIILTVAMTYTTMLTYEDSKKMPIVKGEEETKSAAPQKKT